MGSESKTKFFTGIAGSVITAIIIWLLISPGGIINPKVEPPIPELSQPIIQVTNFDYRIEGQALSPNAKSLKGTFTIYNDGDIMAKNCDFYWRLTDDDFPQHSPQFDLPPKQTIKLDIFWQIFSDLVGTTEYKVSCNNGESIKYRSEIFVSVV